MWEANRIGMCLPQLKEARRVNGAGFPPGALDWLRMRYDSDCQRFAVLLADGPFLHGAAPGIGDCAVWGYAQWLAEPVSRRRRRWRPGWTGCAGLRP